MLEEIKALKETADVKETLIREVLKLTTRQAEALKSDDIEKLIELTDTKQKIINRLEKVTEKFRKCYGLLSKDKNKREGMTDIKNKLCDVRRLVDEIVKLEEDNKACLTDKLSEVRNSINNINTEKKAMNSYAHAGAVLSRYIDRRN